MISVIVPVYNIEKFLPKCLDSIIAQTYKELEILLIDDGSTDDSGKICEEYARKDQRIKVFHKENGGVSSARNKGLELATGDYISFVDGDDLLEKRLFEVLITNAINFKCDISCCQIVTVNIDGSKSVPFSDKSDFLEKEYIIENYFFDPFIKEVMYSVYNKIFRRDLLKGLWYKNYKYGEDILFVFEALSKSHRIYYDNYVGYYYMHRENSAMTAAFSKRRLDYIDAIRIIEEECYEKYRFAYKNAKAWVYQHILITARQIIANHKVEENSKWLSDEKKYLKKNAYDCLSRLPLKRKLDYLGVLYFPIYIRVLTLLKRKRN